MEQPHPLHRLEPRAPARLRENVTKLCQIFNFPNCGPRGVCLLWLDQYEMRNVRRFLTSIVMSNVTASCGLSESFIAKGLPPPIKNIGSST